MSSQRGIGHGVVQRLFSRLDDLGLRGAAALVAFSGGGDSTALAVGVAEARRAGRARPWLAHVEHRVRSGADDVPVVLATAERLHLPLSVRAVPRHAIDCHRGCGVEEAMRRERYLLLSTVASETGCETVMTAHHADDQAETVLGHLIRGGGLDGATGIRPVSTLPVPWWGTGLTVRPLTLVRPLLSERRAALRNLVAATGLPTVDDATNGDIERTRAALRHEVIPVLERISLGATVALGRFAEIAGSFAVDASSSAGTPMEPSDTIDLVALRSGPVGAQRMALRTWIHGQAGVVPTFERVESVRRWVAGGGSGCVEVGRGCSIRRSGGQLEFTRPDRDGGTPTTWGPRTPASPGS